MKNNKKLLLAGFAIVPLALSSWTSEESGNELKNIEYDQTATVSDIEIIGAGVITTDKVIRGPKGATIKKVKDHIDTKLVTVDTPAPTEPTIDDIVKIYK